MTKAAAFFAKTAADYKSKYVLGFYEEERILKKLNVRLIILHKQIALILHCAEQLRNRACNPPCTLETGAEAKIVVKGRCIREWFVCR